MQKAQNLCMDATFDKLRVWPKWQKLNRLSISVVHEDSATGARADDFCETLAKYLGKSCGISKEIWPLTELRTPELRAIAAAEAASSDLVIISVHPAENLPPEVKSWIGLWLKQKGAHLTVLAALFDPLHVGSSGSIQTVLQGIARRGNMEFIVRCEEKPAD